VPSAPGAGIVPINLVTPSSSLTAALSAATKSNSPIAGAALPVGLGGAGLGGGNKTNVVDQVALMRKMEESQEFSDNWDDDFADGISLTKLSGESGFDFLFLPAQTKTRRTFELPALTPLIFALLSF